ncbi:MAG TPA: hypothetical protein VGM70_09470 [Pseudolysinimonas sp.]|jgi:hypothetical protein
MLPTVAPPPWWGDGVLLAWVAIAVALAAAGFTFWQAFTAHRNRLSANERTLVEWAPGDWVEPLVVEVASKGPDEARDVWAVMTIQNREIEVKLPRVRRGDTLRFPLPEASGAEKMWNEAADRAPRPGEIFDELSMFSYGLRIAWHSPLGRPDDVRATGDIRRRVASRERPDERPWAAVSPDQ